MYNPRLMRAYRISCLKEIDAKKAARYAREVQQRSLREGEIHGKEEWNELQMIYNIIKNETRSVQGFKDLRPNTDFTMVEILHEGGAISLRRMITTRRRLGKRLPETELLKTLLAMAEALNELDGVLYHSTVSPNKVLVKDNGYILSNYRCAVMTDDGWTSTGTRLKDLNQAYAPPEVINNLNTQTKELSVKIHAQSADVFALGMTIFHMATLWHYKDMLDFLTERNEDPDCLRKRIEGLHLSAELKVLLKRMLDTNVPRIRPVEIMAEVHRLMKEPRIPEAIAEALPIDYTPATQLVDITAIKSVRRLVQTSEAQIYQLTMTNGRTKSVLKVLHCYSSEDLVRLQKQVEMAQRISRMFPRECVQIHKAESIEDRFEILMDYCESSLQDKKDEWADMSGGKADAGHIFTWLSQCVNAFAKFQECSARGLWIYHGNVCPGNLLLSQDRIKVAHFAHVEEGKSCQYRSLPTVLDLKKWYLAPDVLDKWMNTMKLDIDKDFVKADVFSLGVTFLELLTMMSAASMESLFNARKSNHEALIRVAKSILIPTAYSKHVEFMKQLLIVMLDIDSEKRPDFLNLRRTIEEFSRSQAAYNSA